ncbi:Crp/Fnr family transcriptional regulator [Patescibacteria group bacterium]|nr:Crp/Fnr family transcriptional regulator [Patescibacteria group bacterium]
MDSKVNEKVSKFFLQFPSDSHEKGEILISANDKTDSVSYLKSGYVKMYSISEAGKEITLNIFKPGTYFPAMSLIAEQPNYYFYESMTPIETINVTNENFLDFLRRENDVFRDLSKRVFSGLNGILVRMTYLLSSDAQARVAAAILMAGQRFGIKKTSGEIELELSLTHKDIADLSVLTRETTSTEIGKLVKEGLIKNENKSFTIIDIEGLRDVSRIYDGGEVLPHTF